jgi:hypothetical protein
VVESRNALKVEPLISSHATGERLARVARVVRFWQAKSAVNSAGLLPKS